MCSSDYHSPKIESSNIDTTKMMMTIKFNETMQASILTNRDLFVHITGINGPFIVTWDAEFDNDSLQIKFSTSPKLVSNVEYILA